MTTPPAAWPEIDEDLLHRQADALKQTKDRLVSSLDTWQAKKTAIFNPQSWFGGASTAARQKVESHIQQMESVDQSLAKAIAFYNDSYRKIVLAKDAIIDVCDAMQTAIDALESASDEDGVDRSADVKSLIDRALSINSHIVSAVAAAIGSTSQPAIGDPKQEVSNLIRESGFGADKKQGVDPDTLGNVPTGTPPGAPPGWGPDKHNDVDSDASSGGPPAIQQTGYGADTRTRTPPTNPITDRDFNRYFPQTPSDAGSPSSSPSPVGSGGGGPSWSTGAGSGGGTGGTGGKGDLASTGSRNSLGDKAESQSGKFKPGAAESENRPLTPFEQQQLLANEVSKGLASGGQQAIQQISTVPPAGAGQAPLTPTAPETPVATPPAAAAGPSTPAVGGSGFGAGGGGGVGAAPISSPAVTPAPPPMPLGPPATPPPAGPVGTGGGSSAGSSAASTGTAPTGPGVHAASTNNASQAAQAAPAPIPVSAARMERDAIASAAAAGAIRRQKGGGGDALTLARRIAAALNVGNADFGFYWVTGLCVDGTIVVANSYGLAYIPAGVNLPASVQMATADETIPPADRAKWATYPMLAVQGWAHAHNQRLRAVIATEAQFANFDPGTARVVLQSDDIPDTGKMDGRSRLEVIAPAAAAKLGSVADSGLTELLPPPSADTEAPEDTSASLWFDLCKPLMSRMPDRWVAHLESFLTYAEHAQDLALHRALTATDATRQRTAIADWVYWQHLSVLVSDALSADVAV